MKKIILIGLGLLSIGILAGCGSKEADAPPTQPEVEVKTMEEIGKLTPEQEAAQLRQQDQRPAEDKQEGGL